VWAISLLEPSMNTIEQFQAFAKTANAITVDDSPIILDWETAPVMGDPENQVFTFRWYLSGMPYGIALTEKSLMEGTFSEPGKFVCDDSDGDRTVIRFFSLERLTSPSEQPANQKHHDPLLKLDQDLVTIETGIPGDTQESSFMNATLQEVGNDLSMSIASHFQVPDCIAHQGENAVSTFVKSKLNSAASQCVGLHFHVQVGPSRTA
jgi:hypothetical protein